MLLFVYSVPPLIYRLSLKSTLWFYFPVAYIVSRAEKTKDRLVILCCTRIAWVRFFVALVTVAGLVWKSFVVSQGLLVLSAKVITPLALFWAIDIFKLRAWDWCSLGSAALTIILFFWADKLYKLRNEQRKGGTEVEEYGKKQMWWMEFFLSIRNLTTIGYLLISAVFVTLLFSDIESIIESYLPQGTLDRISSFFERPMPMDVHQDVTI